MENKQLLCDHCHVVLFGKIGTAYVNKNYIEIRGRLVFERFNKDTMRYEWTFIAPSETDSLTFCVRDGKKGGLDFDCLEAYIEYRLAHNPVCPGATKSRPAVKESTMFPAERPKDLPEFKEI
jgi:hypothetical protein